MYKMSSRIYFEGNVTDSEQVKRYSTEKSYVVGNQCTDLYVDERGQSAYVLLRCISDTSGDWQGQAERNEVNNQWTIAEGKHTFDNLKVLVESLFFKKVSLSGQCFEQKKIPLNTKLELLPGTYQFGGMANQSATRYHLEFKDFNSLESTIFTVNQATTGTLYLVVEPNYVYALMDKNNTLSIKIYQYTGNNWKYHWNPSDWEFVKGVKGYNAGKQYKPGNKCIYQFGLYKCLFITPSSGEPWLPAHWEPIMQDVKQWMDHVDIKWANSHVRYMAMYLQTNACLKKYNANNEIINKNGLIIDIEEHGHKITVYGNPMADTRITVCKDVKCDANHAYYMDGCPSGESKNKHYLEWGPYKSYEGRCSGGKSGSTHDLVLVIKKQNPGNPVVYDYDEFIPELNDTACYDSNCNGIIWKRTRNLAPGDIEIHDLVMYYITSGNFMYTYIDDVDPLPLYSRVKSSSIADYRLSNLYNGIYTNGKTLLRKYWRDYGYGQNLDVYDEKTGSWVLHTITANMLDGASGISVGNTYCKPMMGVGGEYIHQSFKSINGVNHFRIGRFVVNEDNSLFFEHLAFSDDWSSYSYDFMHGRWDNFAYLGHGNEDVNIFYNEYYHIVTASGAIMAKAPYPLTTYWDRETETYKETTPEIREEFREAAKVYEQTSKDTHSSYSYSRMINDVEYNGFGSVCFKDRLYLYYDVELNGDGWDYSNIYHHEFVNGIATTEHIATALVLHNNGTWHVEQATLPWLFQLSDTNVNLKYYSDDSGNRRLSTSTHEYISTGFGSANISERKYPCQVSYAGTYNNKIYVYVKSYQIVYYSRIDEFHNWEIVGHDYEICFDIFESSDGLNYKLVRKHTGGVTCTNWLTSTPYDHRSGLRGPLRIEYCVDYRNQPAVSTGVVFQNETTGHAQLNLSALWRDDHIPPDRYTVDSGIDVADNSSGEGHTIVKYFGDNLEFSTDTFNGFYMDTSNAIVCWDSVLLDRPKFFYLKSDGSYSQ